MGLSLTSLLRKLLTSEGVKNPSMGVRISLKIRLATTPTNTGTIVENVILHAPRNDQTGNSPQKLLSIIRKLKRIQSLACKRVKDHPFTMIQLPGCICTSEHTEILLLSKH